MAGPFYCDLDGGGDDTDGLTWAKAWDLLSTPLNGSNLAAGETLYTVGQLAAGGTAQTYTVSGDDNENPAIIIGVKTGTTNEPPVQSDFIPGWRTGQSRSVANRASEDGDIPSVTVTGSADISFSSLCSVYVYAMKFVSANDILLSNSTSADSYQKFEECVFDVGDNFFFGAPSGQTRIENINCRIVKADYITLGDNSHIIGNVWSADPTLSAFRAGGGQIEIIGCDLTLVSTLWTSSGGAELVGLRILNCALKSGFAVSSGSPNDKHIEVYGSSAETGLTSAESVRDLYIDDICGTIVNESTAVRTGGASDGVADFSLAMLPGANQVITQYRSLVGPWMAFKVTAGTTKTVTVYIANSGAADYYDDEVWLEVAYPSESGTTQFDNQTTQLDLGGTRSQSANDLKDDTVSTWGTGGNNPQKLIATINPDYIGRAYCRVHFARTDATPETLYVDPEPEYA